MGIFPPEEVYQRMDENIEHAKHVMVEAECVAQRLAKPLQLDSCTRAVPALVYPSPQPLSMMEFVSKYDWPKISVGTPSKLAEQIGRIDSQNVREITHYEVR